MEIRRFHLASSCRTAGGGELIEDPYEEERKADAGRHGSTTTGRIIPRLNVLIPDHQGTGSVYIGP